MIMGSCPLCDKAVEDWMLQYNKAVMLRLKWHHVACVETQLYSEESCEKKLSVRTATR